MSDTTFVDRQTPILASWLNDVNDHVYRNTNNYYVNQYGTFSEGDNIQTYLDAAYTAAVAAGGGNIIFPPGNYLINGLSITDPYIKLIGAGAGFFSSVHTEQGTRLTYAGTAGGTMITLSSVSGASNQKVTDCGLLGIALDGNSSAAIGLLVASVNNCEFNLSIKGCTTVQCEWKTVTTLVDNTSSQDNRVYYLRVQATGSANGIKIDTDVLGGNTSFNIFGYMYVEHTNGYGIRLGNSDNNVFQYIRSYRPSGVGVGVILGAGNGVTTQACRANQIHICAPGDGGLFAEGTPTDVVPSDDNRIWYYDQDNPHPEPTIETGAKLAWGTTNTVFFNYGFANAGFGLSQAQVSNAVAQAIASEFPIVVSSGNGKHIQLSNATGGVWSLNVAASTDSLKIVQVSGAGRLNLDTAYLGNYVNDAAAAAGGVEVGDLYRNGSVVMVRVA